MAEIEIIIDRNGVAKVKGEGPQTKAVKRALEDLGVVEERHVGAEHVRETQTDTQTTGT